MYEQKVINSKLNGLLKLEFFQLPHPNWKIVIDQSELPDSPWCSAKHGWTVRTAYNRMISSLSEELHLPYANKLSYAEARKATEKFLSLLNNSAVAVIYPSWEFQFSGTIDFSDNGCLLESVYGSIGKLTSGKTNPAIVASITPGPPFIINFTCGDNILLTNLRKTGIFRYLRTLSYYFGTLEWTFTENNQLYFHQWDIKSHNHFSPYF